MPINVDCKLRDGESSEKLIKRFFKKCKKAEIIREYLDKTSYHRTRSQKRRDKILRNKFLRKKEEADNCECIKKKKKRDFS